MNDPFPYDKLSLGESFVGREEELSKLKNICEYSNNLLIYSKRRMGKSSLIKHFFEVYREVFHTIYVDIFDITSKEDFAKALLKALSNSQKTDIKSAIKSLTSFFKRVRLEPSIDTNTLEYSIKPIVATLNFEEMMEDFFNGLANLSKNKKVVFAIDEFQQIANISEIKLDAYLRKEIQERGEVSYIFLGSKRHLLTSLFEYKAPLYEMATHFELPPLEPNKIAEYAKKHIEIDTRLIEYICEIANFETKMIQNILHLLYVKKEVATKESIDAAKEEIINSKESSFRLIYDTLNNNQKIAIKIVAKYKKGFFAQNVLNEYNIKKQTLQSSIDSLLKRELIDKVEDAYFIPDRTLELWMERLAMGS